ncbi:hypothetical protein A9Z42_0062700 [Trichoderma parareesei]|uniref:Uncharacterized protein n=1 Tax=Trichoderma parareesei TaxID=858221 RepID=A0A2H2Z3V8_TRIPA|nr:hypothetical protein A9Z42_0062700 [Trichoderma parareesei]
MALLNPLYALVVPFLLVTTIPLAIFAGITTTFAFSILILRVFIVWLDIALSLVSQSLSHLTESSSSSSSSSSSAAKLHLRPPRPSSSSPSSSSSIHSRTNSVSPSASSTLLKRHRRRRPSSSVYSAAGSATPASDIGLGLIPSVGPERDFEGVGGWRLGDDNDENDDDDRLWTTINSRYELPDRMHDRNHRRSLSGGPAGAADGGGFLMMKGRARSPEQRLVTPASPNSSKARAPSAPRLMGGANQNDGYFPMSISSKATKRNIN